VEGFADQLVSESVYLRTPDYIGFEVYADRPTGEWIRRGSGGHGHTAAGPRRLNE
jgi:catechol 2,3-dioxygenase